MIALTRRACWSLLGAVLLGCLSPTLPLPPPTRPTVEGPDSFGQVVLSGQVEPGAQVIAENLHTGDIAGQRAPGDGRYRFKIRAALGDQMSIYYRFALEDSPSTEFLITGRNAEGFPNGGAANGGAGGQAAATTGGASGGTVTGSGGL